MDGQQGLPRSGRPGVPRTGWFFDVLNSMGRKQAPLTTVERRAGPLRSDTSHGFFVDLSLLRARSHERNSFIFFQNRPSHLSSFFYHPTSFIFGGASF